MHRDRGPVCSSIASASGFPSPSGTLSMNQYPTFDRCGTIARCCLLLLVLSSAGVFGHADDVLEDPWRWSHFTADDGLPAPSALRVKESADGVLWAATANGLVRRLPMASRHGHTRCATESVYGLHQYASQWWGRCGGFRLCLCGGPKWFRDDCYTR